MLGSLRMSVKDAMKELHALGKTLETKADNNSLDPRKGVEILKEGVQEMLENRNVLVDSMMDDQRFVSSKCKV
jgi:hypothetical protein